MRIKELALEPRCKRDKHRRSTDTHLVEGSYRQQGRSSHKGGGKHRRPTESKEPTTRGRQQKGHQRQGHKKKIHKMSMSNGWDVASVHALGMYTTPCVSRVGVEPTTPGFSVPSSNQLSYRNFIENPRGKIPLVNAFVWLQWCSHWHTSLCIYVFSCLQPPHDHWVRGCTVLGLSLPMWLPRQGPVL